MGQGLKKKRRRTENGIAAASKDKAGRWRKDSSCETTTCQNLSSEASFTDRSTATAADPRHIHVHVFSFHQFHQNT